MTMMAMGRALASQLPRQADVSVMVCGFLEPLQKWVEREIRLCTVTEVGSGKRHFRYHAKVGMFDQETFILRSARPGIDSPP